MLVPMFTLIRLKLFNPVPVIVWLPFLIKVTVPVLPVNVPLFVQLPPTDNVFAPPLREAPVLMSRFPLTSTFRGTVVVPPLTVRLLKITLLSLGIVLVAVNSIVPVPAVQV